MKIEFSKEEQTLRDEIRAIYNSGHCDRAVEMSNEFLKKFPNSFLARYSYAVMAGDFSFDLRHSQSEKDRLMEIAKKGIGELFNDPKLEQCPEQFQLSVKNEYFWFYEMPEQQYQLGIDTMNFSARNGHYSACVGASMTALKLARLKDFESSRDWAEKSMHHFQEFEKLNPEWYNINYFGAQSLACLGKYDEAITAFKDMFRKQGNEVDQAEVSKFNEIIVELRSLLKS